MTDSLTVVVLAAGEGRRMRSATPKVLHTLGGRTMLGHVLAATSALQPDRTLVVVGHGRDKVVATLPASATPVVQDRQGGTGHAVRTALDAADVTAGTVLVVPGDAPLITAGTLRRLVDAQAGSACTVLTSHLDDPTGYGRIVRGADGGVERIVEHRDCTDAERAITEVGVSTYAFAVAPLRAALSSLSTQNAAGEEYLTDVLALLRAEGQLVGAVTVSARETFGVNDRVQLAAARRLLNDRLLEAAMLAGVTVVDPATTWLDVGVGYDADATVLQNTRLHGSTHLGAGSVTGPDTTVTDSRVGPSARVEASTVTGSDIGAGATVGPYAHLRKGTTLGPGAKVGAFAETKNADLGAGAKVPHLAYVGDASVGPRSNIGAGTIFANYDGVDKHRAEVGADVKIGSNNTLVAPVKIGDGAYTGGDSLVRKDVPPGALVFSANEQVTKPGWVADRRPGPDRPDDDAEGTP
ncbi:MAG TPA: bifunctional UDP-N-acetylglucosamine diphosphorylase/glucosamine-1-phosphate N-acetyltransferase GlmU [Mycobacteriales bacterium]